MRKSHRFIQSLAAAWLASMLVACGNHKAGDPLLPFATREPLRIVVTFPPGGGTDWLARKLGAELQNQLGVPVVVDNKPGASGNIGAKIVADAPADGHTLLMVNSSFAINPGVFSSMDFDPKHDFTGVINVGYVPSVFVVPQQSSWQSLSQALDAARAQPALPFASCGNGTPQHLAGEMLAKAQAVSLQQVPYKGCGPALAAVLGNQVPLAVLTASSAAPLVHAGKLRALAVTSAGRSELLPQVPSVAEQGVTGYAVDQWHGLLVPAATPRATVQQLNRVIREILGRPAVAQAIKEQGFALDGGSAQDFQDMVHADIARYAKVTQSIGLKVD
ncbi:MAG TPA: tripartite tricarboxylate transporter substrate binding protein [Comamonas sp.]